MALTVIRDSVSGASFTGVPGLRAYLLTESGNASFSFQFAPPVIEYGMLEQEWVQVERVGLIPLLVRKADKLDTIKFTIQVGGRFDYYEDQAGYLESLVVVAKSRERVMMRYSRHETGLWRITSLAIASAVRDPNTNGILQATADITMTQASDPAPSVGPVSSPAAPLPTPKPATTAPPRTYVVAQGDTLWSISNKLYGRGDRWPVIFDANRDKLSTAAVVPVGTQLVIPP